MTPSAGCRTRSPRSLSDHAEREDGAKTADGGSALPRVARELYTRLAAGEAVEEDEPGLGRLLELGLVIAEPFSGYVAVDLDRAEQRLRVSVHQDLTRSVALLTELPDLLEDLRARRSKDTAAATTSSVFLEGVNAANRQIAEATHNARREVLAAQPGVRSRRILDLSLDRDLAVLARGVALDTLYHPSARTNPDLRERVGVMRPKGARFRTLARPFLRLIVIDRKIAFFADDLDSRPAYEGAWMVRDPAVCAHLATVFAQQWDHAEEWADPGQRAGNVVSTRLQRSILRELAAGQDQQQIAKSLGYSRRTIHARLTELRAELGYDTLYQLIHWWATTPERELD